MNLWLYSCQSSSKVIIKGYYLSSKEFKSITIGQVLRCLLFNYIHLVVGDPQKINDTINSFLKNPNILYIVNQ